MTPRPEGGTGDGHMVVEVPREGSLMSNRWEDRARVLRPEHGGASLARTRAEKPREQ